MWIGNISISRYPYLYYLVCPKPQNVYVFYVYFKHYLYCLVYPVPQNVYVFYVYFKRKHFLSHLFTMFIFMEYFFWHTHTLFLHPFDWRFLLFSNCFHLQSSLNASMYNTTNYGWLQNCILHTHQVFVRIPLFQQSHTPIQINLNQGKHLKSVQRQSIPVTCIYKDVNPMSWDSLTNGEFLQCICLLPSMYVFGTPFMKTLPYHHNAH